MISEVEGIPTSPGTTSECGAEWWWDDDASILHVYPQFSYHDELRIIATRAALVGLSAALLRAAEAGRSNYATMCSDGEGYGVLIERTNDTGLRYARLPYHPEWGGSTESEHIEILEQQLRELLDAAKAAASTTENVT